MASHSAEGLREIRSFPQLVKYLRDELEWPIEKTDFDDLTFDWDARELGLDPDSAAKIDEIKQLRPLTSDQPWGIFFVKFEPKRLPIVALRRILGQLAVRKRAAATKANQRAWRADDLLFISSFGASGSRELTFAHFSAPDDERGIPTLRVLGWDGDDSALKLDYVAQTLDAKLRWPQNERDQDAWRLCWSSAFVLRPYEVIKTSKHLAVRLADLAKGIRRRVEDLLQLETETGTLRVLHAAFQQSLIHDLTRSDFSDMYAQTIAYGLLSSRIVDPTRKTANDFASHMRASPFLRELMETFLRVGGRRDKSAHADIDFDELGVSEVIALLDNANMEAVLRDFGDRNPQEDPVIHFYELFLKEYDPKKRLQRGVFYTPRPVVSYIVRSVDELLRADFGLEDGLADTATWGEMAARQDNIQIPSGISPSEAFVQILDPATGTGTFLVEIIETIHETLEKKWKLAGSSGSEIELLWNQYVPKHLLPRLHGYEILMAPYSIAHLKIGLKLYETGYRFADGERVRVYLTNALEPAVDISDRFDFAIPALANEASAVNDIKRQQRFTVVVGNPPYSILSANLSQAQRALVDRYRTVNGEKIRERGALQFEKNIQDDYVKFFALAESVLSRAPAAILSYVSNANYLDASTLRGLRSSLFASFSTRLITDLHGDGSGRDLNDVQGEDENVFEILQGVAICLLARFPGAAPDSERFDLGGSRQEKFDALASSTFRSHKSVRLSPVTPSYELSVKNAEWSDVWDSWIPLNSLAHRYSAGVITARDHLVIDRDRAELMSRIESIRDSSRPDGPLMSEFEIPVKNGWDFSKARKLLRTVKEVAADTRLIAYRPFDDRWIFYHQSLIWGRAWPTMQHVLGRDNLVLAVCRQLHKRADPWCHAFVCVGLGESSLVSNKSKEVTSFFPINLVDAGEESFLRSVDSNLEMPGIASVLSTGSTALPKAKLSEGVAHYIYAILHSPTYRSRFRDSLARDFPRIPEFCPSELAHRLVRLGSALVGLHLMTSPIPESSEAHYHGPKNPTVGRISWSDGTVWLDDPPKKKTATSKSASGSFAGISESVWNFHIGAYQVCEKWLKDRKGGTLTTIEIAHYQKIVGALSETLRLMNEIDCAIELSGGWPAAFSEPLYPI